MSASVINNDDVSNTLREVFGFSAFLPNQEAVVKNILSQKDTVAIMPTGGGKSLCYQLPARILPGTCLVISPLIALMKDQVDAALANGLRAAFLNSSLSASMKRRVEADLLSERLDLLYVSPERFAMPEFVEHLKQLNLAFVAIDEAHCISEWGHDFRPDYLNLSTIGRDFPEVPVAAFTATATHRVQEDIVTRLGLRNPHIIRASFNRPNLFYKVVPKNKPSEQILKFVSARPGEAGIIYRTTRKSVEQTAELLSRHGIRALPYHAGLDDAQRIRNQEAFNRDDIQVIVATIAFGMGIDKSNVRYVLHGDLPKNVEGYYQETGRAGRDGEPAQCLLLFGYGDIPKIRFFIDQMQDEAEQRQALRCLNNMINYASVYACRRKQLLNYFGEDHHTAENTSTLCCDVCSGQVDRIEATVDAQIAMSAIARTGQRFGITHVVAVICGEDTPRIQTLGHDRLKTYGAGRDKDRRHWRMVIDNLLSQGLIEQSKGEYPVLTLAAAAKDVLFNSRPFYMLKSEVLSIPARRGKGRGTQGRTGATDILDYDEALFEKLRVLRKKLASEQGVPPYVIFSDRSLHEMARDCPTNAAELLNISGVGAAKLTRYGKAFLDVINSK